MPIDQLSGLLTGLLGVGLAVAGLLLALLGFLRLLWVARKPGKGRIARGIAMAGLVLLLSGVLLFTIEEVGTTMRAASDRSARYLAAAAVVVAALVGLRAARRKPAPARAAPEEAPAQDGAQQADAAERR